jgi:hypothetical protein
MLDAGPPPSPLHAAVQVADLIRTSLRSCGEDGASANGGTAADAGKTDRSFLPPGVVDGAVAGCAVLAILSPVRSRLIRYAGSQWGMLPDVLLSSSQGVASCMAALYMGSLQGSRVYLKKLASADPNLNEWVPRVCCSSEVQTLLNAARSGNTSQRLYSEGIEAESSLWITPDASDEPQSAYYFTQDPRRQTLEELARALETCRRFRSSHPTSDASNWTT